MAREKREHALGVAAGCLVAVALLGWIGYSSYNLYESSKPMETIYTDLGAITDYMNTLNVDAQ